MSMRKIILISNVLSMSILSWYTVKKGLDIVLGITLLINAVSIALNIYSEVKYGRKESQTTR